MQDKSTLHENCKKLERCHFLLGRKHTFLIRALRINTKPSFSLCTNILKTGDYVNYYKRTGGFVYTFPLNVTVFRQTSHAFFIEVIYLHQAPSAPDRYRHAPGILQNHAVVIYPLHIIKIYNIRLMASVKSVAQLLQ